MVQIKKASNLFEPGYLMVSVSLNSTGDRANPIVTKRKVVFTPFRILDKEKFLIVIHYVVYIRLIENISFE